MPDHRAEMGGAGLCPVEIGEFQSALLAWFARHRRDLPWRKTSDPYAIWVSEIMLQQTRVTAAIPFFERFLTRFPDYRSLAQAGEADVLAQWAGLGYYYRARNLQKAAQAMCESGGFPDSYEAVRALAGVGEYTAAAVASIAFGLPHAAVDGNALRVLSRVLGDRSDIGSARGRKHFSALARELLATYDPGSFNQAMMELGATICLPANPQCLLCPVRDLCRARRAGIQNQLPVKRSRAKTAVEHRSIYWIERRGAVLLWQRPPESRLMSGFWELPEAEQLPSIVGTVRLGAFRHGITFHDYRFEVWQAAPPIDAGVCQWIRVDALATLPVSTILRKARRISDRYAKGQSAAAGRD